MRMEKQKLNSQSFFKQSNTAPFRLNSVKIVRKNHISSFSKNPTFDERENISQKTFNFKDITFTSVVPLTVQQRQNILSLNVKLKLKFAIHLF